MKKKVLGYILEAPVVILFTITVLATFYIKIYNPGLFPKPLNWATPITLLVFLVAYFWGRRLENKDSGFSSSSSKQHIDSTPEVISLGTPSESPKPSFSLDSGPKPRIVRLD